MVRPWLGTVDPRAEGEALPCAQIALVLSVLGTVGIGAILSMGVVTLYGGRLHFRSIRWRLSWWVSCVSVLVGIARSTFFCGSPANSRVLETRLI
jgi:hypothetical protein